ncbi:MAG: hypothetical protein E3J71_04665 [Candidatus Stahlbacteria bacterium]|nr:MAG: hypothetical protein E3J71_04665 [Candidatus Stahlbacteria bacterium]
MNALIVSLVLISAPWQFGLDLGYSAGLYNIGADSADYTNPNSGCHVEVSRPGIPPPGFFHIGLSLEDERSIGFAVDLNVHYKNYTAKGHIENIPYYPLDIDATQDIPYVHVQWAWGLQKSFSAANDRVLFPLGFQFTNNWFIPAATQAKVEEYINTLTLEDIKILVNDYRMAIDYVKEHRMGMRLNFGFAVAAVHTEGFSWLFGTGLDWNILFGSTSNGVVFYPEFGLSTAFRF